MQRVSTRAYAICRCDNDVLAASTADVNVNNFKDCAHGTCELRQLLWQHCTSAHGYFCTDAARHGRIKGSTRTRMHMLGRHVPEPPIFVEEEKHNTEKLHDERGVKQK